MSLGFEDRPKRSVVGMQMKWLDSAAEIGEELMEEMTCEVLPNSQQDKMGKAQRCKTLRSILGWLICEGGWI